MRGKLLLTLFGALLVAASIVVACSSDSSSNNGGGGNEGGQPSETGSTEGGGATSYALANLDERCQDGPSGRQLLVFVRQNYAGTYTPPGSRPPGNAWTGSTTPSALTMSASYENGPILCMPSRPFNCPPGAPCAAPPPPTVSVALNITFRTADGTLAETFVATATWESNFDSVNWQADVPATAIDGTYPIAAGSKDAVRLSFNGSFQGAKCNGSISELTNKISFGAGGWTATESEGGTDAGGD